MDRLFSLTKECSFLCQTQTCTVYVSNKTSKRIVWITSLCKVFGKDLLSEHEWWLFHTGGAVQLNWNYSCSSRTYMYMCIGAVCALLEEEEVSLQCYCNMDLVIHMLVVELKFSLTIIFFDQTFWSNWRKTMVNENLSSMVNSEPTCSHTEIFHTCWLVRQ